MAAEVVEGHVGAKRKGGGIDNVDAAFTRLRTWDDFHGGVVGGQAVDLVQPLLYVAQIERFSLHKGKSRSEVNAVLAVVQQVEPLDLTLHDKDLQSAGVQILSQDIRSDRDVTAVDVGFQNIGQ